MSACMTLEDQREAKDGTTLGINEGESLAAFDLAEGIHQCISNIWETPVFKGAGVYLAFRLDHVRSDSARHSIGS